MKINLFSLEEAAEKCGFSSATIRDWINSGILNPEGYTEDSEPVFSGSDLETVKKIGALGELGYETDDIRKIIKKFGLPPDDASSASPSGGAEKYLTVGTLAEKTAVSARTIKHWEEKGIIEPDLRSRGGFRLYRDYYILFCNLIKDLQLFGYSLDEIKTISDYFRDFVNIKDNLENLEASGVSEKIRRMEEEISRLFIKTEMLKNGIRRWEDLLKKKKKQINLIKEKNRRRFKGENSD